MKCEHCHKEIEYNIEPFRAIEDTDEDYFCYADLNVYFCPNCRKPVVNIDWGQCYDEIDNIENRFSREQMILLPKFSSINDLPKSVPKEYVEDFTIAHNLVEVDNKACIMYCRYIIEKVIKEIANIKTTERENKKGEPKETNELRYLLEEYSKKEYISNNLYLLLDDIRKKANSIIHVLSSEISITEITKHLETIRLLYECEFNSKK